MKVLKATSSLSQTEKKTIITALQNKVQTEHPDKQGGQQ